MLCSSQFAPTYKFQPNTDLYECRPDKKLRAPAWCDRVLWHSKNLSHVQQLNYLRSELNISDHKPVMSTFNASVKSVIAPKRQEVYAEVMRTLDKFENQSLPKVDLNKTEVDFGDLYYQNKVKACAERSEELRKRVLDYWRELRWNTIRMVYIVSSASLF